MKLRPIFALVLLAGIIGFSAKAWSDTMGAPHVERTQVVLKALSANSAPLTIALISDIHVAGPDMSPDRLEEIVEQINALKPDIVLIAGDLVSEKRVATHMYTPEEIVAPLGKLDARLGVVAVPGNHDHWFDLPGLAAELEKHGIALLSNDAIRRGPLVIGGLDDDFTDRADLAKTLAAMRGLQGTRLLLSHSPDPFPNVPNSVPLMLAGHTHCGQIAYPWGGAPATMSDYGERYACGRVDEYGRTLVVGAGLGTSLLPIRLFTQAEIWLIELVPAR
uniref:metallophosphoesterase n=1 Tax=Parerythrobacter lutipelagi TaxID=1964208 RepID=UPI0010F82C78|nr:metallophosphoesterase [Parerythrobacter lutipelagi]